MVVFLGRRDLPSHMEAMETENIQPIDLFCVNLYPFKETIMKPDVEIAEAIENIDIGGPSMPRSAAKTMNLSPLLLIHLTMKKYFQNYVSMGILHFFQTKTSGKKSFVILRHMMH